MQQEQNQPETITIGNHFDWIILPQPDKKIYGLALGNLNFAQDH